MIEFHICIYQDVRTRAELSGIGGQEGKGGVVSVIGHFWTNREAAGSDLLNYLWRHFCFAGGQCVRVFNKAKLS